MLPLFLRPPKTLPTLPPKTLISSFFFFSSQPKPHHETSIGSPARVQKLIASQPDPLLAKEIFDLAARHPNFRHSYSSYFTLILKLARAHYFSLADDLLLRLKSQPSPALFTHLIQIYGDAHLPQKALRTFYTMFHFNCHPSVKHLNRILGILVSHRNFLRPAFEVFRDAHRRGVAPDTKSYNILMRAFCLNGDLSVAYHLFNKMFEREVLPDVESYRILMQGLCRKGQVNTAVDFLEDMMNKGYVPDSLSYTSLLNSLCRKKQLREAYKLLCRMKVKGCNPDIVHYNTLISGFCRQGRAVDACKVLEDMESNGCLPNLVSYRTLVSGLCNQGMLDEAKRYMEVMMSKGFSPHFSVVHGLVKGLCNVGRIEDACGVMVELLRHGEVPHRDTWLTIVPGICEEIEVVTMEEVVREMMKVEIKPSTRIVDAALGLENYLINRIHASKSRRA
ncbi:pentatricopeptide repeat-containing protein At4g01400, mitochondrial [Argentina anserina]|uniref:pentatricopeptide repeat-containing protein At4g01400, mitochondrial n=1 Tax=Argentina anserina TaxID=57926 RepID=UPI0021764C97|nr:pentatricopeptide repeat-containing protein At4g01400, mitochondrial [Potentilla anserina]XP_050366545.1 pentatricopeptide repeat-containing protein At4g01400, mitochondrial [Potentilla anserina]XP_050366546.1 pentatricopeptide repeat-containing protein At4g01400, mitochondrial [Potentilla anserina]XP_050366547.1 pentatricopeptide repeat-containing protein At4g01400, mitochondrial [Potentilla anserina]